MNRTPGFSGILICVGLACLLPHASFAVVTHDIHDDGADLQILSNASRDNLGQGISADLNGDGIDEMVVWGAADYGHGIAKFNIFWGREDWSVLPHTIDLATTRGALYIESLEHKEFAWTGFQTHIRACDFNGDGREDVAFGAFHNSLGGSQNGCVYLLYGRDNYSPNFKNFAPEYFDATFIGGHGGGNLGFVVDTGDLNGDGLDDIAALAPDAHVVLCMFGTDSLPAEHEETITAANADFAFQGSKISGQVLALGDLNGDGRDDVACGNRNETYIYFTSDALLAQRTINVNTTTPSVTVTGRTNSMIQAGDINRDGRDDLIGLTDGRAYVVFARDTWTPGTVHDAGGLVADLSFDINGAYDEGDLISTADFNGDSHEDLVIGEGYSGKIWVVLSRSDFPPNHYMNLADRPDRADIYFATRRTAGGFHGDYDGDGRADLLAPIWTEYNEYGGKVYVVFTRPEVTSATLSPSPLPYGATPVVEIHKKSMASDIDYQWFRNGQAIAGADSDWLPVAQYQAGDRISCVLTPSLYGSPGKPFTLPEVEVLPYSGPMPDLRIEDFDFRPDICSPSGPIYFSGRVVNGGGSATNEFWIEFFVLPAGGEGVPVYLCESILSGALEPGESVYLSEYRRNVGSLPFGEYEVIVRVDPLDKTAEGDESNNRLTRTDHLLAIGETAARNWQGYR